MDGNDHRHLFFFPFHWRVWLDLDISTVATILATHHRRLIAFIPPNSFSRDMLKTSMSLPVDGWIVKRSSATSLLPVAFSAVVARIARDPFMFGET